MGGTRIKKIIKKKKNEYKGVDLLDVNARAAIAFTLTMILAILVYVVFFKN